MKNVTSDKVSISTFFVATNYLFFDLTCADSTNVYPTNINNINDVDVRVHAVVNP